MAKVIEFTETGYSMLPEDDWKADLTEVAKVNEIIYFSFMGEFTREDGIAAAATALLSAGYAVVDADGVLDRLGFYLS